jgi:hypothetical protein
MSIEYVSFLVRLWREASTEATATLNDWCSEVEHIQSGQRWTFNTLEELLAFLRQEVEESESEPTRQ